MTFLLKVVLAASLLAFQPSTAPTQDPATSGASTGDVEWEPFPHCYPCPK